MSDDSQSSMDFFESKKSLNNYRLSMDDIEIGSNNNMDSFGLNRNNKGKKRSNLTQTPFSTLSFKCNDCFKSFPNKAGWTSHMKVHSKKNQGKEGSHITSNGQTVWRCEGCQKENKYHKAYITHLSKCRKYSIFKKENDEKLKRLSEDMSPLFTLSKLSNLHAEEADQKGMITFGSKNLVKVAPMVPMPPMAADTVTVEFANDDIQNTDSDVESDIDTDGDMDTDDDHHHGDDIIENKTSIANANGEIDEENDFDGNDIDNDFEDQYHDLSLKPIIPKDEKYKHEETLNPKIDDNEDDDDDNDDISDSVDNDDTDIKEIPIDDRNMVKVEKYEKAEKSKRSDAHAHAPQTFHRPQLTIESTNIMKASLRKPLKSSSAEVESPSTPSTPSTPPSVSVSGNFESFAPTLSSIPSLSVHKSKNYFDFNARSGGDSSHSDVGSSGISDRNSSSDISRDSRDSRDIQPQSYTKKLSVDISPPPSPRSDINTSSGSSDNSSGSSHGHKRKLKKFVLPDSPKHTYPKMIYYQANLVSGLPGNIEDKINHYLLANNISR